MTPGQKKFYVGFTALSIAWISFFAQWWFDPSHIPDTLRGAIGHILDLLLFLLVSYVIWYPIVTQIFYWAVAYQINDPVNKPPAEGLRVAFINTFVPQSESIELLYECLPAMVNADYPHDTWLLDEGNVPEVRDLCQHLGIKHFSRCGQPEYNGATGKFVRKTKGGNHNSWYDQHGQDYDFVAQMDTDFIPKSNFLTRTLGLFDDPTVAFVGTPQIYGNAEESYIARGAAEQVYNFYGPLLRGFSGMGATLMIGANHVVRVAALQDVDHYSAHITEDLLTGMKLHAKGWKSLYVPEVLTIGEGPATWSAYFNQQMRWAFGCIDILFHSSPHLLRQMSPRRACYYFLLQQHYFSGLAMVFALFGLGLYALFGVATATIDVGSFLAYYVPVILLCELMALWLQRFNIRPEKERGLLPAGRIASLAAWPIFIMALFGVITGKRLVYKVTPKGISRSGNRSPLLKTFTVHIAIAIYSILCLAVALIERHDSPVMLFWMVLSACVMLSLPLVVPIHDYVTRVRAAQIREELKPGDGTEF